MPLNTCGVGVLVHNFRSILIVSAFVLGGCSTVMEANRPSAVNLKKVYIGERRIEVIGYLGPALASEKDDDKICDVYRLYTSGTSKAGKGAIIIGAAAADVFTLGLFEVLATPTEAVTKSKLHTVMFCYSSENKLISVSDAGQRVSKVGDGGAIQTPIGGKGALPNS